jgi:hypothetical protein
MEHPVSDYKSLPQFTQQVTVCKYKISSLPIWPHNTIEINGQNYISGSMVNKKIIQLSYNRDDMPDLTINVFVLCCHTDGSGNIIRAKRKQKLQRSEKIYTFPLCLYPKIRSIQ